MCLSLRGTGNVAPINIKQQSRQKYGRDKSNTKTSQSDDHTNLARPDTITRNQDATRQEGKLADTLIKEEGGRTRNFWTQNMEVYITGGNEARRHLQKQGKHTEIKSTPGKAH